MLTRAGASLNRPPRTQGALIRSAYRVLLKESQFFDTHPLAKALLSASPFLRKDSSWVSVINHPVTQPTNVARFCGVPSNALAISNPKTMWDFVREEFRRLDSEWDGGVRFFGWVRRLTLAKQLHEKCSVSIPPQLPPVSHKLQLLTSLPPPCQPGMMLFAHPVLVDDFTQAVVLVVGAKERRTVGITLNSPCGTADFVLEPQRLAAVTSPAAVKLMKKANIKHFADWPIFNGGSIAAPPVLLHRSKKIAGLVSQNQKIVKAPHRGVATGEIHGGWYVHSLYSILALEPKAVKKELVASSARILMNYSEWETEVLQTEVFQNWWIATDPTSSCGALGSLLEHPAGAEACDETSGKMMWQRAVANLGGDLSDFSRLTIVEEDDGDYRRLISKTFAEDMKQNAAGDL